MANLTSDQAGGILAAPSAVQVSAGLSDTAERPLLIAAAVLTQGEITPALPARPSPRPFPTGPQFGEFGEGRGKGQALARLTLNGEGGQVLRFGEGLGR